MAAPTDSSASCGKNAGKSRFSQAIQKLIRKKEPKKFDEELVKVPVETSVRVTPSREKVDESSKPKVGDEVKTVSVVAEIVKGLDADEAKPKSVAAVVEVIKGLDAKAVEKEEEAKPKSIAAVAEVIKGLDADPKPDETEEDDDDDEYDEECSSPTSSSDALSLESPKAPPAPAPAPPKAIQEEGHRFSFSDKLALPPPLRTGSKISRTLSSLSRENSGVRVGEGVAVVAGTYDRIDVSRANEDEKRALVDGIVKGSGQPIKRIVIEF